MITGLTKQKGFTILEALVAATIFAFGFTATNTSQVYMMKSEQTSMQNGKSSQILTSTIEQARAYSSITAYNNLTSSSSTTQGGNATFSDSITFTANTNYKQMVQSSTWTDSNNIANSMGFTTFISQIDPQQSGLLISTSQNSTGGLGAPNSGSSNSGSSGSGSDSSSNGVTTVTIPGTSNVLTYNNNVLTSINGQEATTISGVVSLATGNNSPPGSARLANITLAPQSSNSLVISCTYQTTGAYTCYLAKGWSGYIYLGGVTNVKVCTKFQQPYSNVRQAQTGQDFLIIKKNSSCSGQYPYLLQSL